MSPCMLDVIHAQLVVGESGRTGRESELSRLGRHMYLTPGVHLLQFRDPYKLGFECDKV